MELSHADRSLMRLRSTLDVAAYFRCLRDLEDQYSNEFPDTRRPGHGRRSLLTFSEWLAALVERPASSIRADCVLARRLSPGGFRLLVKKIITREGALELSRYPASQQQGIALRLAIAPRLTTGRFDKPHVAAVARDLQIHRVSRTGRHGVPRRRTTPEGEQQAPWTAPSASAPQLRLPFTL